MDAQERSIRGGARTQVSSALPGDGLKRSHSSERMEEIDRNLLWRRPLKVILPETSTSRAKLN